MNLFELYAKISLDASEYEAAIKGAEGSFKGLIQRIGAVEAKNDELTKQLNDYAKSSNDSKKQTDELKREIEDLGEESQESSKKISVFSSKLGNGLKKSAKIGIAAVGTAAAGITALTKQSVESYAKYEQLVGGAETLFKESANELIAAAGGAYKTAGLSANEYISTVTGFSASLLQSLEGDTKAAASLADQALVDMSDNANKMGTDMSLIQNAYQGFAKANYTMLDNLKLGYGGTKTEMRRLIKDAAKLDDSVDESSMSFDNIVRAIHAVQTEMGITGTTALEASTTIEGSARAAKAAWENLKVAMASGNGDISEEIDAFVESVDVYADNLIPRVGVIIRTGARVLKELIPEVVKVLPEISREILPELSSATVDLLVAIAEVVIDNADELVDAAEEAVDEIGEMLADKFPGFSLLFENLDGVIWGCINAFVAFKTIKGVTSFIKTVSDAMSILTAKTTAQTTAQTNLNTATAAFEKAAFATAIISLLYKNAEIAADSLNKTTEEIEKVNNGAPLEFRGWDDYGKEPKLSFWDQILYALGFKDLEDLGLDGSHRSGLTRVPFDGYLAELHEGERVLTKREAKKYRKGDGLAGATVNVTINGAKYNDEDQLAEAVARRLQRLIEEEEGVYA